MSCIRGASWFFIVGSTFCGLYAGAEALELAYEHATEQQDGFTTPVEAINDELPQAYLLGGIGATCLGGALICATGLATDYEQKQAITKRAA